MKQNLIPLLLFLLLATTSHAYYQAEQGRWLNRDPVGEYGGINVYSFVYNRGHNCFDPVGLCTKQDVAGIADNVKKRMCCALRAESKTNDDKERGGGSYKGKEGKDARQWPKEGALREDDNTGRGHISIPAPPEQGWWNTTLDEQPLDWVWHSHPNNWHESKPSDRDLENAKQRADKGVDSLVITKDNVYCYDKASESFKDLGSPNDVLDCDKVCCDGYADTTTPGTYGGATPNGYKTYPDL